MTSLSQIVSGAANTLFGTLRALPAPALLESRSQYRGLRFGADLSAVAEKAGLNPSQAKMIHHRPALIQELAWRPQEPGSHGERESVREMVCRFYDGELFQISVVYDRLETEGMTADDCIDAISATYGSATRPPASARLAPGRYGEQEEILAQWQDSLYCFDLIRSAHGPAFRLVGVMKQLKALAVAAHLEAKRLDDQEAPQRDAARRAHDEQVAKTRLEKARLVNKPKFRP